MKRNKKRNNLKVIIVSVIILFIFVLILVSIFLGRKDLIAGETDNSERDVKGKIVLDQEKVKETEISEEEYENSIAKFKEFTSEYEEQTILPRNISVLYEYDGVYERDDFYKNFKLYIDYVSYLKENVTLDNVDTFYSQNSNEIISITGNDDVDNFRNLINAIQEKDVSVDRLRFARIQPQTSTTADGYFKFKVDVFYGDENEQDETKLDNITVEVAWAKSTSQDKEFVYLVR